MFVVDNPFSSNRFIIEHLMKLPEINSISASPITKFVNRTFDGRLLGAIIDLSPT